MEKTAIGERSVGTYGSNEEELLRRGFLFIETDAQSLNPAP
jgi:hypothetical protein